MVEPSRSLTLEQFLSAGGSLSAPSTPLHIRLEAFDSGDFKLRQRVAANPALTTAEKLSFLKSGNAGLILKLLQRPLSIAPEVRDYIINHADAAIVHYLLIRDLDVVTEEEIITLLERPRTAGYERAALRSFFERRRFSPDIVRKVFEDCSDDSLAFEVIEHPDFPVDLLNRLARESDDARALFAAARNPHLMIDGTCPLPLVRLCAESQWVRLEKLYVGYNNDQLHKPFNDSHALLRKMQGEVRPDFWATFSSDWEGTVDEFLEFASALDN